MTLSVTKSIQIILIIFTSIILSLSCQNQEELQEKSPTSSESITPKVVTTQNAPTSPMPAVLVEKNFTMSDSEIDRTGAYIPQNGLPTLVFNSAVG